MFPLSPFLELTRGLPDGSFFVGLSSIGWRESWKYGERSFRYCQHDLGHAIASISFSCRLLGLECRLLHNLPSALLERLLALSPDQFAPEEIEWPECLLLIYDPQKGAPIPDWHLNTSAASLMCSDMTIHGSPNRLSATHPNFWPSTVEIARLTTTPELAEQTPCGTLAPPSHRYSPPQAAKFRKSNAGETLAGRIIRQRRSAQEFDSRLSIEVASFCRILAATLPSLSYSPFMSDERQSRVHLVLFVHRVNDLPSGLYCLCRDASSLPELRAAMNPRYSWKRREEMPAELPLYELQLGEVEETAIRVSCLQEIAGDSAFSLGMLVRLRDPVLQDPSRYRSLFWETGMVGQALYLAAEGEGLSGTGIGCFFDDLMHTLLQLEGTDFQSLYHFTIGVAIEDTRVQSIDPYAKIMTNRMS